MYHSRIRIALALVTALFVWGCGGVSIHKAASKGDLKDVMAALERDRTQVNSRQSDGMTPLLEASYSGNLEVVKYLVSKGADLNAFDTEYHYTPLHAAVYIANPAIAKYLVTKGADVNLKTLSGETPLYLAVYLENADLVKFLVLYGADINASNSEGLSPLGAAEQLGNQEVLAALKSPERVTPMVTRVQQPGPGAGAMAQSMAATVPGAGVTARTVVAVPPGGSAVVQSGVNFGRYYSLVIGNGNYRFLPRLETARHDAEVIAQLLKEDYGFEVKLLLDATRSDILIALENYRRNLVWNDNLLIYYAGHGWLDETADEGYWLPVDASRDNSVNWLSNASITTALKALTAKCVLIVSDSCYSGKLGRGVHIERRTRDYYSRIANKRARSVLSSGGLEPVIDKGGEGNHSVFASAFINALEENTGVTDGTQLFTKIRGPVILNSDQTPEYSDIRKAGHEGGEFVFVRRGKW